MLIVKVLTIDDIFDDLNFGLHRLYYNHLDQEMCNEAAEALEDLLHYAKRRIQHLPKPKEGDL